MDKEEEGVVLDEELVAVGASIFREDIMNMNSREVTPAHPVQREETKLDASTSDIPQGLKLDASTSDIPHDLKLDASSSDIPPDLKQQLVQ